MFMLKTWKDYLGSQYFCPRFEQKKVHSFEYYFVYLVQSFIHKF